MYRWIVQDQSILGGKPIVRGTRLSVQHILELLASGGTVPQIVDTYPGLSAESVREAMAYASEHLQSQNETTWLDDLVGAGVRLRIYRDAGGSYRWRIVQDNGAVMAESTRTFPSASECESDAAPLVNAARPLPIEVAA